MPKYYTANDRNLALYLWPAEEGGYTITSPLDPELITEAETIEEAFMTAYDAQKGLKKVRAKRARQQARTSSGRVDKTRAAGATPSSRPGPLR